MTTGYGPRDQKIRPHCVTFQFVDDVLVQARTKVQLSELAGSVLLLKGKPIYSSKMGMKCREMCPKFRVNRLK